MKSLKFLATIALMVNAIWSFGMQSPPAHSTPMRLRVSGAVMEGLVIHKVMPEYPDEAKRVRATGDVTVAIVINQQGNVISAALIKGNPVLADAAIDAVKQWKYNPYILNGVPIEVETTAVVVFKQSVL
ncbi:MAG TPA: energy transducer TonB [Candidatus Angelobacter sp.]|jgi:protein TonB